MKLTPAQKLMVKDGFPAALFATPAQRAAWWDRHPPRAMPLIEFNKSRTEDDAATAAFRVQEEERRKVQSRAKIDRMKLRFASKAIDHSKMRWDQRRNKFVEDTIGARPAVVLVQPEPLGRVDAGPRKQRIDAALIATEDWSRVTKDNAEAIARLNGVWKDSYEKLRGTGRIVMTVCNILKGKVRRGEEVKWN